MNNTNEKYKLLRIDIPDDNPTTFISIIESKSVNKEIFNNSINNILCFKSIFSSNEYDSKMNDHDIEYNYNYKKKISNNYKFMYGLYFLIILYKYVKRS